MTTEQKVRAFRRMIRHSRSVDATDSGADPLEGMTDAEKREAFDKMVGRTDG